MPRAAYPAQAKAAKISSTAFSWLPVAEDGTRIGVVTPASRHAATPSRTAGRAEQRRVGEPAVAHQATGCRSGGPRRSAVSIAVHLLDIAGFLPVVAVVRQHRVAGQRAAVDRLGRLDIVGDAGRDHVGDEEIRVGALCRRDHRQRLGHVRAAGIGEDQPVGDLGRQRHHALAQRREHDRRQARRCPRRSGISRQRRGCRRAACPASRPCGYGSGACATPMPKRNRPPETSWI